MKKLLKNIALLGAVLAGVYALESNASADSFNITNVIPANYAVAGYPTNVINTNGLPMKNGSAIGVYNNLNAGFYFTGMPITANTHTGSVFTVTLIRSWATTPRVQIDGMTGQVAGTHTNMTTINTWDDTPFKITWIIPSGQTNAYTFTTNLNENFLAAANWIGVANITNEGNTLVMTNVECGLVKKIVPIKFP